MRAWSSASWLTGLALGTSGIGGLPDDISTWERWITLVDHWWARATLVVLALLLVSYPQWLPTVKYWLGIREEGFVYTKGWWKAGIEDWLDKRKRHKPPVG